MKYRPRDTVIYKPLSFQRRFHFSRKPKVYLSGGYGSGKTFALIMKAFFLMNENPGLPGGLLVPNLKMFKRDVLPAMREVCKENDIELIYNAQDYFFFFPLLKNYIYVFHSEDNGDSIRGPNLSFGLINEVTMCSKGAFDAFMARIRLKKAGLLQLAMSGTPEGFNWAYEYFIESPREDTDLIFGNSRENTHVADSYVKGLEDSYDTLMQQQYIDGKFVSMSGARALWSFDRFKHVSATAERIEGAPIWVSLDFNVNPMAATIWNRMPHTSGKLLRAFDEVCLNSSDTHQIAAVLKERYGTQITIFPDPAGDARSTKSRGHTDISILREAGFTDIRYKKAITSVRDCLNASNNLLDKNLIEVHPRCKNFIADAEQCILRSGGLEIDKKNVMRSHWLDGFKDMVDYEFPIVKQDSKVTVKKYA